MNIIYHPVTEKNIQNFTTNPSHGLLLVGVNGAGKEYLSKVIISNFLGVDISALANYPYLKIFDGLNTKSSIEEVRELKKFLGLKTTGKKSLRRFAIVLNAESLSFEAQNAMLKLLEEPPEDTCIILTSSQPHKLKPTVLSRLHTIRVRELSQKQVAKIVPDDTQALRLYNLSGGAPAIFASLLSKTNHSEESEYIKKAKQLLQQKRHQRLAQIEKIIKDEEHDINILLDSMYKLLLMKLKLSSNDGSADKNYLKQLHKKIEKTLLAQKFIANNGQPKIALTNLFYEL